MKITKTITGATLPGTLLLEMLSGSRAYGLDTALSDYDYRGIYCPTLATTLGLGSTEHVVHADETSDATYYPIGHFTRMAIGGNPTVLELLFAAEYIHLSESGSLIVEARNLFLSEHCVRASYGGYASGQLHKLQMLGTEKASMHAQGEWRYRYAKHARHTFRIIRQGIQLLTTGSLSLRVSERDRTELFAIGEMSQEQLIPLAKNQIAVLDSCKSVLPKQPDYDAVADLVSKITTREYDISNQMQEVS